MDREVEFRLTVTRDPAARQKIKQWESDLVKAQKTYDDARVSGAKKSETDINRIRGLAVQAEGRAQLAQEAAGRASLARRLNDFKAAKQKQLAAAQAAQKREEAIVAASRKAAQAAELAEAQRHAAKKAAILGGARQIGGAVGLGGLMSMTAGGAAGAAAISAGAYMLGKSSISSFSEFEQQKIRIEALAGSAEKAKKMIDGLRKLSLASGTQFTALSQSTATMAGFGVEIDDILPKLQQFAAITGGDTQRMERLSLAFAQAAGNGRLMGEELNQMIDAGFNPLRAMSARTGLSITELRKEMSQGRVDIDMLSQAFEDATAAGGQFGTMAQQMANATSVAMGQIANDWDQAKIAMGEALVEAGALELTKASTGMMSETARGAASAIKFAKVGFLKYKPDRASTDVAMETALNAAKYRIANPDKFINNSLSPDTPSDDVAAAMKGIELDDKLAALTAKREESAKRLAGIQEKINKEQDDQRRKSINFYAQQVTKQREINELQLAGAKKELETRKDALALAEKAIQTAKDGLLSAQERFGGMSQEDQRKSIQTLLKARQGGQLSLDEIGTLKNLGTQEASKYVAGALQQRASAGFGSQFGGQLQDIEAQRAALRQRGFAIQRDAKGEYENVDGKSVLVGRRFSKAQTMELAKLRMQSEALDRRQADLQDADRNRAGIRDSIFGGERGTIRAAQNNRQTMEANVQQSIEFVAKFENTSQQIANQVMALYKEATDAQMKDVLKLIEPIRKEIMQLQRRTMANVPGRG